MRHLLEVLSWPWSLFYAPLTLTDIISTLGISSTLVFSFTFSLVFSCTCYFVKHIDSCTIVYAPLIKAWWLCLPSPSRCNTAFHEIFVLCQRTSQFHANVYFTLLWLCSQSTSLQSPNAKHEFFFCQSIFLNLKWNHTFIASNFQVVKIVNPEEICINFIQNQQNQDFKHLNKQNINWKLR